MLLNVALVLAFPPAWACISAAVWRIMQRSAGIMPGDLWRTRAALWAMTAAECTVVEALLREWPGAACGIAGTGIALVIWWWRRKDRRRAASLVGAKSRALRDAIVKRARDASRGARPVLRPVLQGPS